MKYLMIIKHAEGYRSQPIPQELLDAMGEFVAAGFKSACSKTRRDSRPPKEGFRVRSSGGKLTVTDGPFTALHNARQFMELHRVHWPAFEAECEVHPLEDQ